MKKKRELICIIPLLLLSLLLLVSCGGGEVSDLSVGYVLNGGTNPADAPSTVASDSVSQLSAVQPTRENYCFEGWYTDSELTLPLNAASTFSESVTLYAKWSPDSYTLSFELNGGKCNNLPSGYSFGEAIDLSSLKPTKSKHDFDGWYTDAELTAPLSSLGATPSGNITLYAKWTAGSYDIEYELDGGECEGLPEKYTYGIGVDLSDFIPVRKGYSFSGWYFDPYFIEDGTVITENSSGEIEVYAKWTPYAEKLSEMPDVKKGYFGIGGNLVEIDIASYVDPHVRDLSYSVTSSDESVVTADISGDELTLSFMKDSGSSQISVSVLHEGEECLSFSFTATAKSYKRIACVGDSLTAGGYPEQLAELLGEDFDVRNFGSGGSSLTNYTNTETYSSYVTQGDNYQNSLDFNPDLVIIMLGTNDTKKWAQASLEYKDAYKSLVASYKAVNPDVEIVVSTSPEVREGNNLQIPVGVISDYIYPLQLEIAAELGATVVDFHALVDGMSESRKDAVIKEDGVHLTPDGNLELATLIKKTV